MDRSPWTHRVAVRLSVLRDGVEGDELVVDGHDERRNIRSKWVGQRSGLGVVYRTA